MWGCPSMSVYVSAPGSGLLGHTHFAALEDVKHELQALSHQLLVVLLLLDGAEVPQEALHH